MEVIIFFFIFPWFFLAACAQALSDEARIAGHHAKNFTWPVREFRPNNEGWDRLMRQRLRQVAEMPGREERYQAYAQVLSSGVVQPSFTEFGFGVARAPDELVQTLRTAIREGLEAGPREEQELTSVEGLRPWFIDRPELNQRVLSELQHFAETWCDRPLIPEIAYGFRLYRNNTRLRMHVDRSETHVISFILHIASSDDAEPWPLVIEELHGNTHEVILTSGDLVFYESSKVFHGRPHTFKGSWYTSIFVHFYPVGHKEVYDDYDKLYALPPNWDAQPEHHDQVPLEIYGTTFQEPTCPNGWCRTQDSIKWAGPAEHGYLKVPNGQTIRFTPKAYTCRDAKPGRSKWANEDGECVKNPYYMNVYCAKSCNACGKVSLND